MHTDAKLMTSYSDRRVVIPSIFDEFLLLIVLKISIENIKKEFPDSSM